MTTVKKTYPIKGSPIEESAITTIAIRADASNRMGTGHVMRCLTLATMLRHYGIHVIFLSKKHQGNLNHLIKNKGFEIRELSAPTTNIEDQADDKLWLGCSFEEDVEECQKVLNGLIVDLMIVDHYSLDKKWHQAIKKHHTDQYNQKNPLKIMVIDDLANRHHDCDILLDQTLGRKVLDYKKLVPEDCQLLLGIDFIMLRDEFRELRESAKVKRNKTNIIKNILISLGGSDPNNIAEQLLSWLIKFKNNVPQHDEIKVTLVVNQTSIHLENLNRHEAAYSWLTLVSDPTSMAQLMFDADIGIGSSGGTTWERCCLGLPSLSIVSADNQKYLNENLSKTGAIISLGDFTRLTYELFSESLKSIIQNEKRYKEMAVGNFACCDGSGITKVINQLLYHLPHNVFLKNATVDDCLDLFSWQSDGGVRQYFRDPMPVKWKQHCDWLDSTLTNEKKHLLMIKLISTEQSKPLSVGVLRLDSIDESLFGVNASWEVSIVISPKYQGNKLADQALKMIPPSFIHEGVIAQVHSKNIASHKLFSRANFNKISKDLYLLKSNILREA